MLKIASSKLNDLLQAFASQKDLYLPVDNEAGQAQYKKYEDGVELSKNLNTVRSAKDFFFPQTETYVEFKMEGKNINIIDCRAEKEDFVVFGVRACDVASFAILDSVYLKEPVDSLYKNRRDHGIIISLACTNPAQTCFCNLFGIQAENPQGDITSWLENDTYFFQANSEKGKALLDSAKKFLSEADSNDEKAIENQKQETQKKLKAQPLAALNLAKFKPAKEDKDKNLMEIFNSKAWSGLSETCLGCGTCTFVCPTCQCYDIRDFDTGHGIKRFRCWDSCMYSDFTKMAAANPRLTQLERFRQRFMHKLVYYPANNNGVFGCVGCGRCLAKCPISMNIAKVAKTLAEENNGK